MGGGEIKPTRYTREMIRENLRRGYWNTPLVFQQWDLNAELYPNREALVDSRVRLTFAQVKQWMNRLALGLIESGIKRDEAIILQLPNCAEQYVLRFACEKAGILHFPVRRSIGPAEVEHLLKKAKAAGIVILWKYKERDHFAEIQNVRGNLPGLRNIYVLGDEVPEGAISIRKILEQDIEAKYPYPEEVLEKRRFKPTEVSWLAHTTGTTGFPKVGKYLAINRPTQGIGIVQLFKLTANDVIGIISPAPGGPNSPVYWGTPLVSAKVAMLEDFEPEAALKLIEKERITVLTGSPALLITMARHPNFDKYDHSSLRLISSGGMALQFSIGQEIEAKLGAPVIQMYGAMDAGLTFYSTPEDPQELRLTTVGKPISGARIRILDEDGKPVPQGEAGNVEVTGPAAGDGYVDEPEAMKVSWTTDGWYKTGDLGKIDGFGNLQLVGRSKDTIIRGGDKVHPGEVEAVLVKHPKINAVAVVGMPDPIMGERACAFVVPRAGQTITLEEVSSFLKEKGLTRYKIPERVEIVDKIPMAGEEKIARKVMVKQITEKLKAEGKI